MGSEVVSKLTFEQFRQLPDDGKQYELIHGEARLTPAPSTRHQVILENLSYSLGAFTRQTKSGQIAYAPLDVRLGEDTVLQPDLVFVSNARASILREEFVDGAPDLVVEILSPSTSAHDRATKLPIYAAAGVPEFWLIDPLAKTVEVLKLQGKKYLVEAILAGDQTLTSSLFPGWQLPLSELLAFHGMF
jgi:Uma2 family endonuclease